MLARDKQIAEEFKQSLSRIVDLVDFRVFGSRARGDADEYANLDIFVEVESLDKALKDRILDMAWEVGFEHNIVITPFIFTRSELEDSPLRSSPIVRSVSTEGIRI